MCRCFGEQNLGQICQRYKGEACACCTDQKCNGKHNPAFCRCWTSFNRTVKFDGLEEWCVDQNLCDWEDEHEHASHQNKLEELFPTPNLIVAVDWRFQFVEVIQEVQNVCCGTNIEWLNTVESVFLVTNTHCTITWLTVDFAHFDTCFTKVKVVVATCHKRQAFVAVHTGDVACQVAVLPSAFVELAVTKTKVNAKVCTFATIPVDTIWTKFYKTCKLVGCVFAFGSYKQFFVVFVVDKVYVDDVTDVTRNVNGLDFAVFVHATSFVGEVYCCCQSRVTTSGVTDNGDFVTVDIVYVSCVVEIVNKGDCTVSTTFGRR